MAIMMDQYACKKLDLVLKRLHVMGAPKAFGMGCGCNVVCTCEIYMCDLPSKTN